jgi:hypothetical protein
MASKVEKFGLNAARMQRRAEIVKDMLIILFLPKESDIREANSMVTARNPVVTDKLRLDTAGVTSNSSEKRGKSVCTEYKIINVIKLPEKSARFAFLKAGWSFVM